METQNTIPQPATDYLARLVDFRKRAYAGDCVTRWEAGQPFATSWPNLKAEYVDDIAKKLGRYLSPKGGKPVSVESPPVHEPFSGTAIREWLAEKPAVRTYLTANPLEGVYRHHPRCLQCGQGKNVQHRAQLEDAPDAVYICTIACAKRWAKKTGGFVTWSGAFPMRDEDDLPAPSPVEEWVAEVVEPAAKPIRKPRVSAEKTVIVAPTIEYKLGIRNLADDLNGKPVPATAARSRFIEGTYGDRGSYRINPNGRWAQAALKTIAEYETKAAFRWPRQKSKDVSLAGTTAVKPLFTETLGGRKWLDVVAEMQGPAYRGWQPEDPTPDAVRPFPTMNIVQPETYAEAAG